MRRDLSVIVQSESTSNMKCLLTLVMHLPSLVRIRIIHWKEIQDATFHVRILSELQDQSMLSPSMQCGLYQGISM